MELPKRLLLTTAALLEAFPASVGGQVSVPHPGVGVWQPEIAVGGAAFALLEATTSHSCCLILLTDGDKSSLTDSQEAWETWQRQRDAAVFQVAVGSQDTNVTHRLSQLIPLARRVRHLSWCTVVVVVSHDPAFLASFAEWSLRGRLLVWETKLVVVTRLAHSQLRVLLFAYWTFSMMNAVFLNLEGTSVRSHFGVLRHLPYSLVGPHMVQVGNWTPSVGLTVTQGYSLFEEKFSNFYGAWVNVTAIPFGPFWEEREGPDNTTFYSGTDYYTLTAIAAVLNFTVRVLPTSSWVEVSRYVEERKAFLAPVVHTVLLQRLEKIDFSVVYEMSTIAFSMAPPIFQARWQALYLPLSHTVWVATFLALLLMPTSFYVNMMGILLGQSLLHRLPNTSSSRVLLATWLVFAVILGSAYSGNLTAFLTLPKYPPRPETLPQLVDAVDRITMPPYGEEFRNYFAKSNSLVYQKLAHLMDIVPSLLDGQRQASESNQAHLDNQRYQHHSIAKTFTQPDGRELLYIGQESIMPGESAWPLPHDAPYASKINRHLLAVVEGGLYEKWGDELLFRAKQQSRRMQKWNRRGQDSPPSLSILQMQGAFMLLLLGFCLALLLFTGEVLLNLI